ncbi:hypothetical protein CDL12_28937 [Handroanthus impetiginosus]|uniref:Uncharacterized protein n=1 Tax=Handroanthus impetiginosus TaxID=429701 RepID=A0A2G9G065_9LAMI|nr:hypothetical protein CDL12_28937 [Handroanthus impetiginosus]
MYDPRTQPSNAQNHQILSCNNGGAINLFAQKHDSSNNNSYSEGILQFSPNYRQEAMETNNSGENSPPLWQNSPTHPLLRRNNYRALSPNSRAQAIARGQWELMEMVKNMPESSYELSLRDLVEHQRVEIQTEKSVDSNKSLNQREVVIVKKQGSKKNERNVIRSGSFENKGLFLNMVFPFSLKPKKKTKFGGNNTSGKVSPKPEGEKDWWKKRFTGSSDSESSRTSNNSGGGSRQSSYGGGRKSHGCLTGCWPFLHSRQGKSVE